MVTPVKEGTTKVTAKAASGKSASVKVTVYDPAKATKVELEETGTLQLEMQETLQLNPHTFNAVGEEIEATGLKWSAAKVKKKNLVSISADGVVTPLREGTTTITVKTATGKTDTVKVKVVDLYKPTGVVLSESGTVTLDIDKTLTLTADLQPETAISGLTWTSSNKKVATVTDGVVTPVKEGTVTITVKTRNSKTDTVKVKVVDPYKPTGVTLDRTGTLAMETGETVQLTATLYPETARTTLTWKSNAPKVASVDEYGVVTCHKTGSVTISVETANGKKATVKVKGIGEAMPEPGLTNDLLPFLGKPVSELDAFLGGMTVSDNSEWVWELNGQLDCYLSEGNKYDTMPKGYVERIKLNPPGSNHTAEYKGEYTLGGIDEKRYAEFGDAQARLLNDGWELKSQGDYTSSWLYSRFEKTLYDRETGKYVKLNISLVHEWGTNGGVVEVSANASWTE